MSRDGRTCSMTPRPALAAAPGRRRRRGDHCEQAAESRNARAGQHDRVAVGSAAKAQGAGPPTAPRLPLAALARARLHPAGRRAAERRTGAPARARHPRLGARERARAQPRDPGRAIALPRDARAAVPGGRSPTLRWGSATTTRTGESRSAIRSSPSSRSGTSPFVCPMPVVRSVRFRCARISRHQFPIQPRQPCASFTPAATTRPPAARKPRARRSAVGESRMSWVKKPREDQERARALDEHQLAHEEVPEAALALDVAVGALLLRPPARHLGACESRAGAPP